MAKLLWFSLIISFLQAIFTEEARSIKDFRSNPLGWSPEEGFFNVNLKLDSDSKILAYMLSKDA
jgi:hypothetical protein